jgi:hypothetical protein
MLSRRLLRGAAALTLIACNAADSPPGPAPDDEQPRPVIEVGPPAPSGTSGRPPEGEEPDAGPSAPADAAPDARLAPADPPLSFAEDIHPFLALRCVPCHTTARTAGHNVASPDELEAYVDALRLGQTLIDRAGNDMPPLPICQGGPGNPGCLTLDEFALLELWFERGSAP